MTKTTEELKRAMYRQLKNLEIAGFFGKEILDHLGSALEEYLERMRQDAKGEELRLTETIRYNAVLSDAYTWQQQLTHAACVAERDTWADNHELKSQVRELKEVRRVLVDSNDAGCRMLMSLREERDELRNKLQAFEFANKSAGEMLQAANEKIKRQRQSIGQLKNERDNAVHLAKARTTQRDKLAQQLQEARKDKGAASVSDSAGNDPESIMRSVQRNCQHSFRHQYSFPEGILQNECVFCLKVEN